MTWSKRVSLCMAMQKWDFRRLMKLIYNEKYLILNWTVGIFVKVAKNFCVVSSSKFKASQKKIDETVEAMFDVSKVSNEALTWPFSLCISCDLEEHSSTYTYKFFLFHRSFFCWDSRICLSFFFFSSGWDCLWWQSRLYRCLNVLAQNWQETGFWTQCMVS